MLIEIGDKAEHKIDCKTVWTRYCLWNFAVGIVKFWNFILLLGKYVVLENNVDVPKPESDDPGLAYLVSSYCFLCS